MQFIVTQYPKHKYRDVYSTAVMIVEANSAAEAVRKARAEQSEDFNMHPDFVSPKAEPLTASKVYHF